MRDELRGPTCCPIIRDSSGPQSTTNDTTRRLESPAEISAVQEVVAILAAQIGDIVEAKITASQPQRSGDSVSMHRSARAGYRGTIVVLAGGLLSAIAWGVSQVEAYGDTREGAARAALAAEAKAAEAAKYAEQTRHIAEGAADRADVIETKLDRVLSKLDAMEGRP